MFKKTIDKFQKELDEFRFWNGEINPDFSYNYHSIEHQKEHYHSYYAKKRQDAQNIIDNMVQLQTQIKEFQKKQQLLKKKFRLIMDDHYEYNGYND